MTLRKRFDFGPDANLVGDDLLRSEAWDALRTNSTGAFALLATREQLNERAAIHPAVRARAQAIAAAARGLGAYHLASYGVGAGALEALLEREGLELSLAEYAPRTTDRLRALFPACRVELHNLLVDGPLHDVDAHLFHRIDTELSDPQWRAVYRRFAGVPIIVVAAGLVTPRMLAGQLGLRLQRRGIPSGWIRSRGSMQSLWSTTHRAQAMVFADLPGWVLKP